MKSSISSWRRAAIVAAGASVVLLAIAGCSSGSGGKAPSGGSAAPYKIGVLEDLTGAYQTLGTQEVQSIELYFDAVNAKGGIDGHKIELETVDTTSDVTVAVNQFRKLADDGVVAVLGPASSGEGIAVRPIALSTKTPVISLASSDNIVLPPDQSGYIFKQYTGNSTAVTAELEYAKSKGWNKVAMLYANNAAGQDPANVIDALAQKAGVTVTGKQPMDPAATDVTAQLGTLAQGKPDVVFVWTVTPQNSNVAKSAAQIGFKPVLIQSPGAGDPVYITNGGSATNKSYVLGSAILAPSSIKSSNPQYKVVQDLLTRYQKKYNVAPGQFAGNGWDGSILLENAIRKAKNANPSNLQKARDAIRDSLEKNTKDVVGVNAIYTFTADFHAASTPDGLAMLEVVNGKFQTKKSF